MNRQRYQDNKKYYVDKAQRQKDKSRELIRTYKSKACADCENTYPYYVMDFDHVGEKSFTISESWHTKGINTLRKELDKCDVVCANCHRERTHQRLRADSLTDKT